MTSPSENPLEHPGQVSPPDAPVRTITLVMWGSLAWVAVLVVVLAVPTLRTGERDWWVWVPVAGITLGVVGYAYLRRGRGNAELA